MVADTRTFYITAHGGNRTRHGTNDAFLIHEARFQLHLLSRLLVSLSVLYVSRFTRKLRHGSAQRTSHGKRRVANSWRFVRHRARCIERSARLYAVQKAQYTRQGGNIMAEIVLNHVTKKIHGSTVVDDISILLLRALYPG